MIGEGDQVPISEKATARRILLVDGDANARSLLAGQLALAGEYCVDEADHGAMALALAERNPYAAVIADNLLPDMTGADFCRMLCRRSIAAPVLLLSAAGADADVILGLEAGADDFIVKPYRFGVLLARLRARLRRHDRADDAPPTRPNLSPLLEGSEASFDNAGGARNGRR